MNYSTLTYVVEERIATLTLNRPERRNSLDDVMIRELTDVLTLVNRSNNVRVLILTGASEAFCSGMDLGYLQRFSVLGDLENLEDAQNFMRLLQLLSSLKKPTIAMVNGPALGGGCGLAASCDFVFAGRGKARMGAPEVRLGFVPALIMLFLVRRMGEGAARELVLRGDVLDAAAAKSKGLVTEIVEDAELAPRVRAFAAELTATTSGSSIALTKDLIARMSEMPPGDLLNYAANLNALVRKTPDFKKGIEAFLKKEKPAW